MEEVLQLKYSAHEMMISPKDLLQYKVSKVSTVKDVILFKRFFTFVSLAQDSFFKNNNIAPELVVKSLNPVFPRKKLLSVLESFVSDSAIATDLLSLFSWNGTGYLDLQATPIIPLGGDNCVIVPEVLTSSNLIRNVIVKERKFNSQTTNTDGVNEPLEVFTKNIFDNRGDIFRTCKGKKFNYKGRAGEIDLIVWSKDNLYLIECKNPILPTSAFELRGTYDYLIKAQAQLDLSLEAMKDTEFYASFLESLDIPIKDRKIHALIVLGNRLLTASAGFCYPIRYAHELNMIITVGTISSTFGEWRYWENEEFSENDFLRYISEEDPLSNNFMNAMDSYKLFIDCGDFKIARESYSFNQLEHLRLGDERLAVLNKNMEAREEFIRMHNQTIEQLKKEMEKSNFR